MAGTRTSRITGQYGTASDESGNNFEDPEDATDVLGLNSEIGGRQGSTPRRPPVGGIDLGKGLDLEKSRPPRSGIGIEIGKSAGGNLGIGVEVPLPIPAPISGRAGVSIDPATGQIRGGYGGLGIGKGPIGGSIDVGVDTPPGSDKPGCFKYVTVSVSVFSHTYGKNECEPKEGKKDPTPPGTTIPPGALLPGQIDPAMLTRSCENPYVILHFYYTEDGSWDENGDFVPPTSFRREGFTYRTGSNGEIGWISEYNNTTDGNYSLQDVFENTGDATPVYFTIPDQVRASCFPEAPPPSSSPPSFSPPIPNPPPTKKKMNDCCKITTTMLLMLHKHLGVTPIAGMESLNQFAGVSQKGEVFKGEQMAFPFEVPKVWLDPTANRNQKITVRNLSELLFIMGSQSERLENILGTKEFLKDSQQQLRQSEVGTLRWLTQRVTGIVGDDFTYPDPNDFWFNTDDGIINEKKVEVRSIADGLRYLVESQNRLERILPVAEIKNSTIPARWVYPGKKGQLKVGNLIHLIEYMFRADDRARGYLPMKIKVKDANPAVKGDQPVFLEFQSQADLLKEMFKFIIDVEGDGDQSNNFLLRLAMQSCQNHQLNVQNNAMLDAIVEYLDFKVDRTTTKVPMPFSPFAGKEPNLLEKLLAKLGFKYQPIPGKIDKNTEQEIEGLFEGILQNTEVKVPIIENKQGKYLSETLMEILKHASAASAAVSEKAGDGALRRIIDSAGIAQSVSRFLLKKDIVESNGIGDLDNWINSAELGYTDNPESQGLKFPESDPLEPYDRPANENPLIREVDTKNPKAD